MRQAQSAVRLATALLLLLSLVASPSPEARAAEPEVPLDVQAALTLRILEYDRGLKGWAGDSLRVGIVATGDAAAFRSGLESQQAQAFEGLATKVLERVRAEAGATER